MGAFFLTAPARVKRAADVKPYTVDLKRFLRSYWISGRRYGFGDCVRSPSISGYAYQCTSAGEAGPTEPTWPRVLGSTANDGSLIWQAVAPSTNAVDTITGAPTWSQVAPPDGVLLIGTQANTIEETTAALGAGTAGATYRIRVSATTTAGNLYTCEFDLEVT